MRLGLRRRKSDLPDTLAWVDPFIQRIKPYVYVRESDGVMIRMPNEAFRLNRSGAHLMRFLLDGGRLRDLSGGAAKHHGFWDDIGYFVTDISLLLGGAFCDAYRSPALNRIPMELGYIERPVLSELAVTWRCNIKCEFCYAACAFDDGSGAANSSKELDTASLKTLLNKIRRDADVPSVSFTGGEPTLRPDLVELVAHASGSLGMRVNLITNGTRVTPELAGALRTAGLASAQVSIEGPDVATHERITGVKGAFEKSIAGLHALRAAGVLTHCHTTLCGLNSEVFAGMADFAAGLGLDRFSANLVIPTGRGEDPDLAVLYARTGEYVRAAQSAAEAAGIRFMWYSPTPVCLFNPVAHNLGNKGCSACEGLLSVDPYGNILPCSSWREPVGNLLETSFETIWFGDRARHIRDKRDAPADCRKCDDFALCHGACPLYYAVHGIQELAPYHSRLKTDEEGDSHESVAGTHPPA